MKVSIKLLNGDVIELKMEIYSEKIVKDYMYDLFKNRETSSLRLMDMSDMSDMSDMDEDNEEEDEDDMDDEDVNKKKLIAIFVPISMVVKEFITYLNQLVDNSFSCPCCNNNKIKKLHDECKKCAEENGYEPIIQYYDNPTEYFSQINGFINHLSGDSIINKKGITILDILTEKLLDAKKNLVKQKDLFYFYARMCRTSRTEHLKQTLKLLVERFTDIDLQIYNDINIEDCLTDFGIQIGAKMIDIISSIIPDISQQIFWDEEEDDDIMDMNMNDKNDKNDMAFLLSMYDKNNKKLLMNALKRYIVQSRQKNEKE
jgi:hypothetical protein